MSDKPVHERISHMIMVYVGTAGKLANQFSIEDIINEELKPMESQLREADVTATAMGLAHSEMRQENARLREALSPFASVGERVAKMDLSDGLPILGGAGGRDVTIGDLKEAATILANHSGDANKMVDGRITELEEALRLILPMAKGYAAEHPVGRNQEMVIDAEQALKGDSHE